MNCTKNESTASFLGFNLDDNGFGGSLCGLKLVTHYFQKIDKSEVVPVFRT